MVRLPAIHALAIELPRARRTLAMLLSLSCAALVAPRPRTARACAPAPMPGTYVSVTDEEALIVWDAQRRIQHFVRRASFEGTSESFGFLVPTPTRPELAEAPDSVFGRLWDHTLPRVERRTELVPHTCCTLALGTFMMRGSDGATAAAPPVTVLDTARVAGMDATVLSATDAGALAEWLGRYGFERSSALQAWLVPYVRMGWIVTAFRYAKSSAGQPQVSGRAVRMSFSTDRPFYPYREPETEHAPNARVLRVYFVGPARTDGSLGDARAPWGASTRYARPLGAAARLLRGVVPDGSWSASSWLTQLIDLRTVRPTDEDLFFANATSRDEVNPVQVEIDETLVPIPVELLLLGGLTFWMVRRRRRKKLAGA